MELQGGHLCNVIYEALIIQVIVGSDRSAHLLLSFVTLRSRILGGATDTRELRGSSHRAENECRMHASRVEDGAGGERTTTRQRQQSRMEPPVFGVSSRRGATRFATHEI